MFGIYTCRTKEQIYHELNTNINTIFEVSNHQAVIWFETFFISCLNNFFIRILLLEDSQNDDTTPNISYAQIFMTSPI